MDIKGWIDENLSLSPARPARSLLNYFWWIPLVIFGLFAGVQVDGNPISKFASSLGTGARRAIGGSLSETTPQLQEGADTMYGRATQPSQNKWQRKDQLPSQKKCEEVNGWTYCPDRK